MVNNFLLTFYGARWGAGKLEDMSHFHCVDMCDVCANVSRRDSFDVSSKFMNAMEYSFMSPLLFN